MKKMMKAATVALVLAMVAFGPTAAIAATNHNPYASASAGTHFGLIDLLMQILGISHPVAQSVTPRSGFSSPASGSPTTMNGSGTPAKYSTDTATWGGGGRCFGPTC